MDKTIDHRITALNINDDSTTQSMMSSSAAGKYAVDTTMFDSLVEKASSISVVTTAESVSDFGQKRTLKQRYLELTDNDVDFIADRLSMQLDVNGGETVLAIGTEDDGASMELTDGDVTAVSAALEKAAKHPSIAGFARLLLDTGTAGSGSGPMAVTHAREIVDKKTAKKDQQAAPSFASSSSSSATTSSQKNVRMVHFLVRRNPVSTESIIEVRVAVVGNVDAGKSTMLGVLTQGSLDDGRGRARVALFRHKHELDSGRTSSVGLEILGFDRSAGDPVRHTDAHQISQHRKMDWHAVCSRASKLVSFLDLAGHEKYLKTTIFGMSSGSPDYVMLMVGANAGLTGMAREHLGLALALGVPVFVVITKIDMCPPSVLDTTLKQLTKVLRSSGCRKIPLAVNDRRAALMAASRFVSQRVCPVFQVSNVTGEGIDNLLTFLNILQLSHARRRATSTKEGDVQDTNNKSALPLRYDINETFNVPFVGTVVSGVLAAGEVRVGDSVWLGPDFHGAFVATTIKGIHRKRVEVESAQAGQSVSLALRKISRQLVRNGMVITSKADRITQQPLAPPIASGTFEAEIVVLYHSTTITPRYQAMVHCGCVRQSARVLSITHVDTTATHTVRGVDVEVRSAYTAGNSADGSGSANGSTLLRTGDRARVLFQFIRHPECLAVDSRLIFREGRTKGVGKVIRILTKDEEDALIESRGGS
ncbi:hypothetical protein IW140_004272 [Coemansia sp. RSA 1813]|nr:hypothetical protein EV178_004369 [Coemansia sp. RSA 1646]KAJ1769979.1 hypothetical protein LPJ74_003553 [Coemansia sp. RSA 1843]KAJ2088104.1 hypothetical protein IW138_004443 [Coemansia sp. RSA 986]KAJ2214828.1 hypothetical protein EV179_002638 [Coemansia sp. RSA 487]KAJ2567837.1 hypothetical protein IW140_004272 [Coemansia sp. RSA 1813]